MIRIYVLIHLLYCEKQKEILTIQCSSIEYDECGNKYSTFYGNWYVNYINNNTNIYEMTYDDGVKFNSHVDLNYVYLFPKKSIKYEIKNSLSLKKYDDIILKFIKKLWIQ